MKDELQANSRYLLLMFACVAVGLDQFNGDYVRAEMVKAFISSNEYRSRFCSQ